MKLEGSVEIDAAPEVVFGRLLDPEVLARCIPGCRSMVERAPGEYAVLIEAGVGPIKGRFEGTVRLLDVVEGKSYRLEHEAKSPIGHAKGYATFRVEPRGAGTRIEYEGEAKVSGRIAQIGGRLIDAAARKLAKEFFKRLSREVSSAT